MKDVIEIDQIPIENEQILPILNDQIPIENECYIY